MIQKLTLTYISRQNKTSKAGKTYESVGIKAKEHGERFINGFGAKWNKNWKEGDEVSAEVFEEDYQGKKYLKFSEADVTSFLVERIKTLEDTVQKMRETLRPIYLDWKNEHSKPKIAGTDIDYPIMEEEPKF